MNLYNGMPINIQRFDIYTSENKKILFDRNNKCSFTISSALYKIILIYENSKDYDEVIKKTNLSEEEINRIMNGLFESGILNENVTNKKLSKSVKIALIHPEITLNKHLPVINLFSNLISLLTIPLTLTGFYFALSNKIYIIYALRTLFHINNRYNSIFFVLIFGFLSAFLHEMGHAIIAKKYGAIIAEIGIVFYGFILRPCTYICNIVNLKKNNYISIYMAGICINMILFGFFMLTSIIIVEPFRIYVTLIALINFILAFIDMIPFPYSDTNKILKLE